MELKRAAPPKKAARENRVGKRLRQNYSRFATAVRATAVAFSFVVVTAPTILPHAMGLKEYKARRNFSVTAEPAGGKPLPKAVKGASRFVIQKHDASRLHYDLRLQMEGVLKSWAVPK